MSADSVPPELDELIGVLEDLRDARRRLAALLEQKCDRVRALAPVAKAAGVANRRLSSYVTEELERRGWAAADVDLVGISPGMIDRILA